MRVTNSLNNNYYYEKIKVTLSPKCCRGTVQIIMSFLQSQQQLQLAQSCLVIIERCLEQQRFICCLNAMYESGVLTDAGRAFQARAAATGDARSPGVVCHVVSTSSVDVDPEWS